LHDGNEEIEQDYLATIDAFTADDGTAQLDTKTIEMAMLELPCVPCWRESTRRGLRKKEDIEYNPTMQPMPMETELSDA